MKKLVKFILPFMMISMLCSCSESGLPVSIPSPESSSVNTGTGATEKPSDTPETTTTATPKPETTTTATPKPETTTTATPKPETTTTATPKPETTTAVTTAPPEISNDTTMPVLYINTVSTDKNAIDFATKPVATHVSQQRASWTPNYRMPPAPYYEDCTITLNEDNTLLLDKAEAKVKVRTL